METLSTPPNPGTNKPPAVISFINLRKTIGWLGMLLPFILLLVNYFINRTNLLNNPLFVNTKHSLPYTPGTAWKASISHYYYTTAGEIFTGVLIAVALFLFVYKGYPKKPGEKGLSDNALTTIAGIAALGVVVFPTAASNGIKDNLRTFISSDTAGIIHFVAATIFFVALSVLSMVNFRRTGDPATFGKEKEHRIYLICGIAMLSCILLLAIYSAWLYKIINLQKFRPIYVLEAIALIFFGISWLIKGKVDVYYFPKMIGLMK